jgi:hypothetical protein
MEKVAGVLVLCAGAMLLAGGLSGPIASRGPGGLAELSVAQTAATQHLLQKQLRTVRDPVALLATRRATCCAVVLRCSCASADVCHLPHKLLRANARGLCTPHVPGVHRGSCACTARCKRSFVCKQSSAGRRKGRTILFASYPAAHVYQGF